MNHFCKVIFSILHRSSDISNLNISYDVFKYEHLDFQNATHVI
jgi:hypothetical protein